MPASVISAAYAAAVFLSAALLFTAQLSFAKALLPLLGGTPAVWNTAMVFYQTVLLAGYAYAHGITRIFSPRAQIRLHVALLLVSLLTVPIAGLPDRAPPTTGSPVLWLIGMLAITLGPTLFLLSATSPLIQAWFRRSGHERAEDPYFLYAPSNLGSMLALLGYPFLIEPMLALQQQHRVWAVCYALFAIVIAACGALIWRSRARTPVAAAASTAQGAAGDAAGEDAPRATAGPVADGGEPSKPAEMIAPAPPPPEQAPRITDRIWWLLLAMVPSSLVLGVTTYLSTDVAAFPLLWVLPLSLYLLTFVLTFARRPPIHPLVSWYGQLGALAVWIALYFLLFPAPTWARFTLHLLVLFFTAMVLHGELVRRRPAAQYLTQFYLFLALGGALGAAFNALLAPVVFRDVVEYPLAILVAAALRPALAPPKTRLWHVLQLLLLAVLVVAAIVLLLQRGVAQRMIDADSLILVALLALAVLVVGRGSPRRLALVLAVMWVAATEGRRWGATILLRERSFFGVYEVRERAGGTQRTLVHGTTLHGSQWVEPEERRTLPTSYYAAVGPLGHIFASRDGFDTTAHVGGVGLGAGTVACYKKPGQRWTFFELDPLVERIARDTSYFTYLRDCAPGARVVLGDARISLRFEPDDDYDLLIMDAFTSDAVPVHLLTREALAMYARKIKPDGLIAFHISNRYVSLEPVLAALAEEAGYAALLQRWNPTSPDAADWLLHSSSWVVMARDSAALGALLTDERWRPLRPRPGIAPWTDDYSSVPSVLIWRARFAG